MNDQYKNTKPKRRWLRISLRSFLIVVTIFCIWIGWFLYRVEQQREAVAWVMENGGSVYYDYQLDSNQLIDDSQPPVPNWLLNNLDIHYFYTVSLVMGDEMQVSDVTPLAGLTNLEKLYLSDSQVSDVSPLAGLSNLRYLGLHNTRVSDVTQLAGLSNLEELYLPGTVSNEDMENLKQALPNCYIYH